jgi:sec-independent protein translocase protein TatA
MQAAGIFGLGMQELLVILVLVLIIFGAGKLPEVMGQFGKGIKSFKEAANGEDAPRRDGATREGHSAPRALPADPLDDPAHTGSREREREGR